MWRDVLNLVWELSFGALTLAAALGALGALLSGGWQPALALLLIAAVAGWLLLRRLRSRRGRRC